MIDYKIIITAPLLIWFAVWFVWTIYNTPKKVVLKSLENHGDKSRHWKKKLYYVSYSALIVFGISLIFINNLNLFAVIFTTLWGASLLGIIQGYVKPDWEKCNLDNCKFRVENSFLTLEEKRKILGE